MVKATSTVFHGRFQRGHRKPRTYEVEVEYDNEQAELEDMAVKMGHSGMSGFFLHAARFLMWILKETQARHEQALIQQEADTRYLQALEMDRERERALRSKREREGKP